MTVCKLHREKLTHLEQTMAPMWTQILCTKILNRKIIRQIYKS